MKSCFANNKKWVFMACLICLFAIPFFGISASSDLREIWSEQSGRSSAVSLPIETAQLGNIAVFMVYFIFAFLGLFSFITIFVGRLKMFLAGNNEDDYYSAKYTFITGIVSFVLVTVIYISLDYIFPLVKEWSSRMA